MKTIHVKIIRDIRRMRGQVITIALIVACGVAVLVSAWSAYLSLRNARDRFYAEYAFGDIFAEFKKAPADVALSLASVPGVRSLETRVVFNGIIDMPYQDEPSMGTFVSTPSDSTSGLNRVYLRTGRMPIPGRTIETLVNEGFARAHHLKPSDSLSVTLNGQQRQITIVGIGISPEYIYALNPAAPLPDDKHFGIFWLPQKALEELCNMGGSFNAVTASINSNASSNDILSEFDRILKPYGNLGAYSRARQPSNMIISDEISQQKIMAFFMPFIFLSISAFLVHVIVSRLVSLQRNQIATLKACGYTNFQVASHYLTLVAVTLSLGAVPGVISGLLLGLYECGMYQDFFKFPSLDFVISPAAIAVGVAAGVIPGLLGALSSILAIVRMPPAEAMKPPSPPVMHQGILERLHIQARISIIGRMVIRDLLLRPWRMGMTIIGMSASLALIITSSFWRDTIFYIFDTQFQIAQREDFTVNFIRPLPIEALNQIQAIPGVLEVEGYHMVPIRFRYKNYKREIAIQGWPSESRLRKLVSTQGEFISLPHQGLLVSNSFHEWWGAELGEMVDIEALDGTQRNLSLPITGFTNDLIGNSAYMEIHDLWRVFRESETYNLAALHIDPRQSAPIFAKLKSLPGVASVNVKTLLYESFKKTMAGVSLAFTYILIGFAVTITLGIIYNAARVTYSERSWELASLRILGFDQISVKGLMLAEIAFQVILSLPLGCVAGRWLAEASLNMVDTETFSFPLIIHASTYVTSVAIVIIAFLFSGIMISRMVDRTKLTEALKMAD